MPRTEAELEAEVDRLDALITSLSESGLGSYKVGSVSVSTDAHLRELRTQRDDAMEQLRSLPYEGEAIGEFDDE